MKLRFPRTRSIIAFFISLVVFGLLFHYWDEVKEFIVNLFT